MNDNPAINENRLNEIVSIISGRKAVSVSDISYKKMKDGTVGDVYLIQGNADDGNVFGWSVILKIIKRWQRYGDPESWDREKKLYESGVFENLPPQLKVPKCYSIDEISDDEIHLWLEPVSGSNGQDLKKEEYWIPAYHLGLYHGQLTDIPVYEWLSCRHTPIIYAGMWSTRAVDWVNSDRSSILTVEMRKKILNVWKNRDMMMETLMKLPYTICHRDFHYENVFVMKDGESERTVLIDWDTTGLGAFGEDIADFTCEALQHDQVPPEEAHDVKDMVLNSYIKGLDESGWNGSVNDIEKAFSITVALHWTFRIIYKLSQAEDDTEQERLMKVLEFCLGEAGD